MHYNAAIIEPRATSHEPRHDHAQKFPVRIAHVIGKMRNGGVDSAVLNYYKYIDRSKIQYDFLIDEDSPHIMEKEIKSLDGRIVIVPPYQKAAACHKALYTIFKENNYPLVYSHLNTLSVFPLFAAWRAGIPIRIAHSHSTAGRGRGEFRRNVMKYILRPFAKLFPTDFCACSEYAGRWMFGDKAMNSGRVKVWKNAIELERFAYNEELRNETRKYLKLKDKFIVGHAGRFMRQKNHGFLIDIFAEIHRRRDDAVLLLAGDGELMDEVTDKVMRLGLNECVVFLGNVHDMERYYQAMDVFIFPSLYEGLPVVGSEVQVSGLPFLCADTVTPETKFCDNMRFMSLRESPRDWAREALRISNGHIRRDMSQSARDAGFDIKAQGARMSEWYCQLLGI